MNIQDRLRHCAKHTGLDAVVELLNEAATHIEGLNSTPKLQGDPSWWMRETDEGAEWTDTAPLVLSGWTPLYTTPQPAQATQAEVADSMIREAFLANGFTIKDGRSDLKPYVYAAARAILAMSPERAPMTWPKARDVGRFGDMSPSAHMRVGLDGDNDVYVSVWDETGGGSIEFCTPGAGGGSSSRTRQALIDLMVAMEEDNAERPDKDWWARRMGGITAQPKKETP